MTDLLSSSQFWLLISIGFYALGVEIQNSCCANASPATPRDRLTIAIFFIMAIPPEHCRVNVHQYTTGGSSAHEIFSQIAEIYR